MYLADGRTAPDHSDTAGRPPLPGRRAATVPAAVFALGTVSLITDVSSEMVTAVLPLYLVAELGLSPLGFGLLDGVHNGVSALVRLVGGRLADRGGGHKSVALAGYGLSALCKPLLLVSHGVPLIGAVLAADRTGKGLRTAPRDAMISLACEPGARGRAFGVHRAMDTAGALLGPLLAFVILRAAAGGYDAVFVASGCVAALGVLVLMLFVPGHTSGAPRPARPAERAPLRSVLRRPDVRRLTSCAMLLGLTTVSDSFLYLTLQRRLDLSEAWFPLLPLGTATAFLVLAVPLGAVADRVGRRRLFLCGHLALLAAYGLLVAPLGTSPALCCLVLALHGSFYAATDGVLAAATADAVPKAVRGTGLAVVQTGQAGARFLCSIAFGAAWTAWGDRTALGTAAAGLAVSAALSALLLRPPPTGDTHAPTSHRSPSVER
ncbi:MFS transporter [Streptomyces sp. ISL-11]|uniref:MFS transporter n=1 Tax=Streptomyces sp. ISL-11 TaxID=2819174 RepID=UPI001BE83B4A|nr:MFS transporter [Streptomyces sp. ISL-11]MBT2384526.1 MFS transporter [Streptomyces sp. ISL-11]